MSDITYSRDYDANAAVACAEAFLALAEPIISKIPEVEESTHGELFSLAMGNVAAAATNLAFAIELYIKAILRVSHVDVKGSHDLGRLYASLPQHFKTVIENFYEQTRKRDWNGRYPSIVLAKQPRSADLPTWDDDYANALDLQALFTRSSDVFTSFRYIYEVNPDVSGRQYHRFEYGLLLSACRAIRATIDFCRSEA